MADTTIRTFEWLKGELTPLGEAASLSLASAGLPAGAYTTLRTYQRSRILRLGQHLERLRESAALQGHEDSLDGSQLQKALRAALRATDHPESRLRLTWAPPRLFVSVEPFRPLPESLYEEGVACVTLSGHRDTPHAKDTRFIATAAEAFRRLGPGVHEGLLVDADGSVLEGLSSNFFSLLDGALHTDENRVLLGVTRGIVLQLARDVLPACTDPVKTADLGRVSEAFITSASRGILPVARIDLRPVGGGRPGPVTRELMARLAALAEREAESP